ncbi:hypothetical protein ACTFIZ_005063 [Dictyostelium cf. discoideum]
MKSDDKYARLDNGNLYDDDSEYCSVVTASPQLSSIKEGYCPVTSSSSSNVTQNIASDPNKFPTSFPFILGNEICERFSFYGIKTILILYLTNYMEYSDDKSTVILHSFNFVAYLFPILGAYIADAKIGKFKTILIFSIVYVVGSIVLSVTSIDGVVGEKGNRSPIGIIIGLGLIAMGTGAIKSNVPTFAGDQLKSNQGNLLERLFQIFYWCINLGSLASTLLTPILRKYVGFWLAFGIPSFLLICSTIIFVIGSKFYVKRAVSESILWTTLKIMAFAIKEKFKILKSRYKRNSRGMLYTNPYTSVSGTNWMDLSKIEYDSQLVDSIKAAMNVLLVFTPLPFFWCMFDQTSSRWTIQAAQLNTCLFNNGKSVCIEPEQIQALNPLFIMVFIPIVEFTIYKPLKHFGFNLKPLIKMSIGMVLAVISFLIAMFLQISIDKSIKNNIINNSFSSSSSSSSSSISISSSGDIIDNNDIKSNLSVWLLFPQYLIITIAEILISIPGLEFAYANAPSSMKSIIMSGWLLAISIGNIFVVFVVDGISFSKQWTEFLFFASVMLFFTFIFIILSYRFKPTDISVTQYSEDLTNLKESLSNSMFFSGGNNKNNNNNNSNNSNNNYNNNNNNNNNNNDTNSDYNNNNNYGVTILTDQDNLYDEDYRSIELESNLI